MAHIAAAMVVQSTRLVVRWSRPDQDDLMIRWYKAKVQRRWMALGTMATSGNAELRAALQKDLGLAQRGGQ